jgi:hypothetical protein
MIIKGGLTHTLFWRIYAAPQFNMYYGDAEISEFSLLPHANAETNKPTSSKALPISLTSICS